MNWWEKHPNRLQQEMSLMKSKFPQFKLGKASQKIERHGWTIAFEGQKYWVGNLRPNSGNVYTIVVVYPKMYPGQEIRSFVIEPYIQSVNHRYGDGHLCLYSNRYLGLATLAPTYLFDRGVWTKTSIYTKDLYPASLERE